MHQTTNSVPEPLYLVCCLGSESFLVVSQLQSVRGFALDGDHDEAMTPVASPSKCTVRI